MSKIRMEEIFFERDPIPLDLQRGISDESSETGAFTRENITPLSEEGSRAMQMVRDGFNKLFR